VSYKNLKLLFETGNPIGWWKISSFVVGAPLLFIGAPIFIGAPPFQCIDAPIFIGAPPFQCIGAPIPWNGGAPINYRCPYKK
jgi:hypothetical protein